MTDFRQTMGYVLVFFTLLYIAGVTVAWVMGCQISDMVKEAIMFCLAWLMAKSGTIIDYLFGTSQGSEAKTKIIANSHPPGNGGCRYPVTEPVRVERHE